MREANYAMKIHEYTTSMSWRNIKTNLLLSIGLNNNRPYRRRCSSCCWCCGSCCWCWVRRRSSRRGGLSRFRCRIWRFWYKSAKIAVRRILRQLRKKHIRYRPYDTTRRSTNEAASNSKYFHSITVFFLLASDLITLFDIVQRVRQLLQCRSHEMRSLAYTIYLSGGIISLG